MTGSWSSVIITLVLTCAPTLSLLFSSLDCILSYCAGASSAGWWGWSMARDSSRSHPSQLTPGEGEREAFPLLPSVNKIEKILTDVLQVMRPSIDQLFWSSTEYICVRLLTKYPCLPRAGWNIMRNSPTRTWGRICSP